MYKIIICLSDINELLKIQTLISLAFQKLSIKYEILIFDSAKSVLQNFELPEENPTDVIIIDTNLNGINGVSVIHKLRKMGSQCKVIYLSDSKKFAFDAIKTNVFQYILKKNYEQILLKALIWNYKNNFQPEFIIIKHDNEIEKVKLSEILYFEIFNRGSNLIQNNKTIHLSIKMNDLIERLPNNLFCRCHFSFCVNIKKVVAVKRYEAKLENGLSIPISKTRYDGLKNMFLASL